MNIVRRTAKHILDWMIVLKIEDDYIQKECARQESIRNAHRIEVERLLNERKSKEEREYDRAARVGEQIRKSAELCMAAYGHHNDHVDNHSYRICLGTSARSHNGGFKSVCTQCGMLFDHNRRNYKAPLHHIGSYCDCDNCRKFVGRESPFVIGSEPESWVLRAKWSGNKIRMPEDQIQPIYARTDSFEKT